MDRWYAKVQIGMQEGWRISTAFPLLWISIFFPAHSTIETQTHLFFWWDYSAQVKTGPHTKSKLLRCQSFCSWASAAASSNIVPCRKWRQSGTKRAAYIHRGLRDLHPQSAASWGMITHSVCGKPWPSSQKNLGPPGWLEVWTWPWWTEGQRRGDVRGWPGQARAESLLPSDGLPGWVDPWTFHTSSEGSTQSGSGPSAKRDPMLHLPWIPSNTGPKDGYSRAGKEGFKRPETEGIILTRS